MGRAKLNMELIAKEKSRNITFKKRKEGLIRKMHEFTTLCDVSACMIIYGPTQDKAAETWPASRDEVRKIIDIYKAKSKDSSNKTFGLADFFRERKRKVEEELAKIRKKNMEAKYPTWLDFMNTLTEAQLREFAAQLVTKLEYVRSRIQLLHRNHYHHNQDGFGFMNMGDVDLAHAAQLNFYTQPLPPIRGMELDAMNMQAAMDHHQQHVNSMMLMNNDHQNDTFGVGPSSTGNLGPYKRQPMFYESNPMAVNSGNFGMADLHMMMCQSPKNVPRYLPVMRPAPPPPPPPSYAMQCSMMAPPAPPLPPVPMSFSEMELQGEVGKEEGQVCAEEAAIREFQMKLRQ